MRRPSGTTRRKKERGDRAGKGQAYGNLGSVYSSQGAFSKAIEYHTQELAITKEVSDRAKEGAAYSNLGNEYYSQGDYAKAVGYHSKDLAIAKEVGDRAGELRDNANLSTGHMHLNAKLGFCHMHLNKAGFVNTVAYFKAQHALAMSLKFAHLQCDAALNMGVALTLHVWAGRQGPAASAAHQAPGPHSHSSASAYSCRVPSHAVWL